MDLVIHERKENTKLKLFQTLSRLCNHLGLNGMGWCMSLRKLQAPDQAMLDELERLKAQLQAEIEAEQKKLEEFYVH
eukprot:2740195-Amphidinium_carterae.1